MFGQPPLRVWRRRLQSAFNLASGQQLSAWAFAQAPHTTRMPPHLSACRLHCRLHPLPPPLYPPPTHILRHPNLYTPRTPAPPNTHTPHSHSHQQQPTQDYRQRRVAQERDKQASATADFHALFDGGLSMGELPPGVDIERLDTLLQQLGPELAQELGLRWVGVGRECLMGLLGGGQGRERRVEARRQRSLTGCAVCCCCCVF